MNFGIISIILILIVAFLAGMEGILDQFQFHQPIVACSLIGIATGHPTECIMLGGTLQLMAMGWANVGAAVSHWDCSGSCNCRFSINNVSSYIISSYRSPS